MLILGIETSCDETAVSVIETKEEGGKVLFKVRANAVLSQIDMHREYGGVFPTVAKREHAKNLVPLVLKVVSDAGITISPTELDAARKDAITAILGKQEKELLETLLASPALFKNPGFDAIAVTAGPGLEPALWVGINGAKALSTLWDCPLVPVNHMEGHVAASLVDERSMTEFAPLKPVAFPALALLISGGHTELILAKDWHDYALVGRTRDDAVGEAFDKAARLLGLPYPGGPEISKLAAKLRESGDTSIPYPLPRPMIHSKDFDFSFSGIKTAVLYTVRGIPEMTDPIREHIAKEFEDAATEVLVSKTRKALREYGTRSLIVGGGVIANVHIRKALAAMAAEENVSIYLPEAGLSTDNALMIGIAGALHAAKGGGKEHDSISAAGNLAIEG
jgi:N6-L-threonylcarbamoyladenine synthase